MLSVLIKIVLIVTLLVTATQGKCSNVYGARPCTYLPAPPGRTPNCANPGDTFCEYPKEYPMQHIRYLIDKLGYDYSTLFRDETPDEYSTYFAQPDYGYTYGPPNTPQQPSYYQQPINIPKPAVVVPEVGNQYIPPPSSGAPVNYTGYQNTRNAGYTGYSQPQQNNHLSGYANYQGYHSGHGGQNYVAQPTQTQNYYSQHARAANSPHMFDPNSWWRLTSDGNYAVNQQYRNARSAEPAVDSSPVKNATAGSTRTKRQSDISTQRLCRTRSQFIMPRAALNSKGNWMYVVNLQQIDNRFSQLVKSETCAGNQKCSGLCGLPNGYTSRCEQKFVQKRLVALDGAGQQLYTDVFWFPSCCICSISGPA